MKLGLVLLFTQLLLSAQTSLSAGQKCRVEGQVVNSVTNEPVRKARVTLMKMGGEPRISSQASAGTRGAVTDAGGRFAFSGLEPGTYVLAAHHEDFQDQQYRRKGQRRSFESLTLMPGEEKSDIVMRLTPLGVISGRVVDEDGDPVRRLQVSLMVYQYNNGHRELAPRNGESTNDLGEYRIFGVAAGRYYLRVSPQMMGGFGQDQGDSYAASYYPGSSDAAGATPVELNAGQQLRGIDFTLHKAHAASIRGRAIKPAGGSYLSVGLSTANEGGGSSAMSTGNNDADGKFELRGVAPGSYFVTAQSAVGDKRYSARVPIQVGSTDIEGIELHLVPPMELRGHVRIEGKSDVKPQQVTVNMEPKSQGGPRGGGAVNEDGSFTFKDLEPDVFYFSAFAPGDLYLKAVRWGDADVTESGVDLTGGVAEGGPVLVLSASRGEVEGTVENDKSEPVADAVVTLVPLNSSRLQSINSGSVTDAKGHFSVRGLAPGSYKLFAWDDIEMNGAAFDPEFRRPFESMGQRVDVSENGKETVHLKVISTSAGQ